VLSNLKKYQTLDIHQLLNMVIKENEKGIIKLNQDQMYEKGVTDTDAPNYKERYAESTKRQKLKKATYKKIDFITLRWDGDFYESMKIILFNDNFVITADDLKWANWLEPNTRFGKALGLTDESMSQLRELVRDSIIRKVRNV
jgi:hypothetical protein